MNDYTIFWLILAVVLAVIEANTANLTTIWFAISALVVSVLSAFGIATLAQLLIFIIISVALLLLTRSFVKKVLSKRTTPTNADRIILESGVVTEAVDPIQNTGQIKVLGQYWSAKSQNGEPIELGSRVTVLRLEGVKAVVQKEKSE
ncbi:MAG: NfeD family protein [Clostridia bacterium]|nr:NfeD family protein [Clostridia bacterium]